MTLEQSLAAFPEIGREAHLKMLTIAGQKYELDYLHRSRMWERQCWVTTKENYRARRDANAVVMAALFGKTQAHWERLLAGHPEVRRPLLILTCETLGIPVTIWKNGTVLI